MDDLVEWLRAQLDDDERVAREAAADFAKESGLRWRVDSEGNVSPAEPVDNSSVAIGSWGGPIGPAAEHIVRHDPARVLGEVDAKRRIIDSWEASQDDNFPPLALIALDEVVKALALPYSDRPGYQEEWRP